MTKDAAEVLMKVNNETKANEKVAMSKIVTRI